MSERAGEPRSDPEVVEGALAAVRDARSRALSDYLFGLAWILAAVAVLLLAAAAATTGSLHDVLLNLAAEVAGAWLTLLLVDGLLRRLQVATSASLDAMTAGLEGRRGRVLSAAERQAWQQLTDAYWSSARHRSLVGRVLDFARGRRRLEALEAEGNRTLAEYRAVAERARPDA